MSFAYAVRQLRRGCPVGALVVGAICCVVTAAAQEPKPADPPKPPSLERLREEVTEKQKELAALRDAAKLKEEVAQLEVAIRELELVKLPDAEREVLRTKKIPALRKELEGLREAEELQREAAALQREMQKLRMTPEERAKADAQRLVRITKLQASVAESESRIRQEEETIRARESELAALRTAKPTGRTSREISDKEREIVECRERIAEARSRVRKSVASLQDEELPLSDDFSRASATNREYRAAVNLRPEWLPEVSRNSAAAGKAPDGTWWCVRNNDGFLELRAFGSGIQGQSVAHNWASYYRDGGK